MCPTCGNAIPKKGNTFCSSSCSARFNNLKRKKKAYPACKHCTSSVKKRNNTYCSNKCQIQYESANYIKRWLTGAEKGWYGKTRQLVPTIRRYLLEKYGNTCVLCPWNKLHPVDQKPLVEVDHIDGDAENCREENLRVLCPNCHSMTPTFRRRNSESKRIR